jgi:hypothetical protein
MLLHFTCPNTYWDMFIEQYLGSPLEEGAYKYLHTIH